MPQCPLDELEGGGGGTGLSGRLDFGCSSFFYTGSPTAVGADASGSSDPAISVSVIKRNVSSLNLKPESVCVLNLGAGSTGEGPDSFASI